MDRREFLIGSGSFLMLMKLSGCASSLPKVREHHELAVFWHGQRPGGPTVLLPQASSDLIFIDPETFQSEIVKIPITAHSLIQDEDRPEYLYLFSKWSKEIGVFRRDQKKLVKVIERPDHFRVYGHGVWDPIRKGFWYTENHLKEERGYLVFLNQDFKEEARIFTGGFAPHEVELSPRGELVVVNSLGYKNNISNVAWIDLKTLKLKEVVDFPVGSLTHLTQAKDSGSIFVSGFKHEDNSGAVVGIMANGKAKVIDLDHEPGFRGEVFSFVHDEKKNELLWVNPLTGVFFTWDLKQQNLKSVKSDKAYKGMIEEEGHLYLATAKERALYEGNKELLSLALDPHKTWGVHLHSIKKIV